MEESFYSAKEKFKGTWVAQSLKHSAVDLTQVMPSGFWDQVPCWTLGFLDSWIRQWGVGLSPPPAPPCRHRYSLSLFEIDLKILKKNAKEKFNFTE